MKKVLIATLFIIALIVFLAFRFTHPVWESKKLVSSNLAQTLFTRPSPTPSPSPRLKTFKFDSGTDLKKELDSVNPQVLDSDFGIISYE